MRRWLRSARLWLAGCMIAALFVGVLGATLRAWGGWMYAVHASVLLASGWVIWNIDKQRRELVERAWEAKWRACTECGYPFEAKSDRCSECGASIDAEAAVASWRQSRWGLRRLSRR